MATAGATDHRRPLLLPTDASFGAYEGFVRQGAQEEAWVRAELSHAGANKPPATQAKKRARADGGGDDAAAAAAATAEEQQQHPRRSVVTVVVAAASASQQKQQQQQQQQGQAVARELAALTGGRFLCDAGAAPADAPNAATAAPPPPPPFAPPPLRFLAALARQMDEALAWPLLARAPGPEQDDEEEAKQQQQQGRAAAATPEAAVTAPPAWRLELALRDRRGRAHAALVRLDPRAFPAAPPFLVRPLALPLAAGQQLGGSGDGGGGAAAAAAGGGGVAAAAAAAAVAAARGGGRAAGAPRTLAQLVALARASVAACEPVWDALDDLDAHCWVLDPPAPAAGGGGGAAAAAEGGGGNSKNQLLLSRPPPPPLPPRGGLCCRFRRIALGGHASLHVELAPVVVAGATAAATAAAAAAAAPPPRVSVLGGGAAVAELQRRWAAFDAARGWARCEGRVRPWLEAGLGVRLPPPPEEEEGGGGAAAKTAAAADADADAAPQLLPDRVETDCAICFAYLLPAEAVSGDGGGGGAAAPEEVPTIACARGGGEGGGGWPGAGGGGGHGAAAADPRAPGCGRAFHRRCISEWLQALPSTSRCFGGLRGECPYCGAEVEVGAAAGGGGGGA